MTYFTRLTFVALLVVLSLTLTILLPKIGANGQEQQDRIVVRKSFPVEPVKVVAAITKRKGKIEIGKGFDDVDDWLDGFTITVSNDSSKTVTALTIEIVFPRAPGDTKPPVAQPLHFGPSPTGLEYIYRNPNKIIKIGNTIDLQITPEDYQSIKDRLQRDGYPNNI